MCETVCETGIHTLELDESFREEGMQNCHADEEPVLRLAKVGGARILINSARDFFQARQSMHNDRILLQSYKFVFAKCVQIF